MRRSEEIRREAEARTEKNQEHEKQPKQENQEPQQNINQPKPNYKILPWIIGGTVILIGMFFVYLFTKKRK